MAAATVHHSLGVREKNVEPQSTSPPGTGASSPSKLLLQSISAGFRSSLMCMGSGRVFSDRENASRGGSRGSSDGEADTPMMKVMQGVERVKGRGYSEEICEDIRNHFARLPARYASNIDGQRPEDVLLHMDLLRDARLAEASLAANSGTSSSLHPLPQVHVRKVQLMFGRDAQESTVELGVSNAIRISKPAFGSSGNLARLLKCSLKVHPAVGLTNSEFNNPTKTQTSGPLPVPAPATSTFCPLVIPVAKDQEESYGYEITLATSDRPGLFTFLTSTLSSAPLRLKIKEAHVLSTSDGMALEVFVVQGWPESDPDELKQAILQVLSKHFKGAGKGGAASGAELRASVEALAYEDWTIDYDSLEIGDRLGSGSCGRLHRGKYLGQDVAIKIIELECANVENESGTPLTVPAAELLQIFEREVSIMRLVRQKNVVQFIGACSSWPRLCIVSELMSSGSVRDVMDSRGCGLEMPAALKVLRDAARGMDFLHRRGIVHRDLKAANLLLDEHDVAKVCDFGVARLKSAGSSNFPGSKQEMTAETGTYRWMAPEMLEHKAYDHKADVYSFGILMWEVITGEVPFAGLTPLQAAIGVIQRNLRPVMPQSVPEKVRELAERCWNADPEMRPEFSEALVVLEELVKPPPVKKSLLSRMRRMGSFTYASNSFSRNV